MRINKEGYKIIFFSGVVCLLIWWGFYRLLVTDAANLLMWGGTVFLLLFWFFIVAFFRELFGSGSLLGFRVIPESWYITEGGFYSNCGLMLFPPMALIIVGCIIWVHRSRNKDLQEK